MLNTRAGLRQTSDRGISDQCSAVPAILIVSVAAERSLARCRSLSSSSFHLTCRHWRWSARPGRRRYASSYNKTQKAFHEIKFAKTYKTQNDSVRQ